MHGLNLSIVPELENQAPLLTTDANLGGMRNLLPLDDSSMFGAGKNPAQLRNLMRKLSARISREPNWPQEDNANIPSGYTYLMQFIAHDMVNTSISLAQTDGRRFGFLNARQQPLTLDTIYGGGPDVSPHAYEYSRKHCESRGQLPRIRLRSGRIRGRSGSTAGMPFADIGRATPVDVRDDGFNSDEGTTPCLRSEALVADSRNEDQALISQIAGLFHRLHNFIVDQVERGRPSATAPDAYRNFICARFLLTLLYRKIIVKDVLWRLLDPSVARYYLFDKGPLIAQDAVPAVPLEFSHGAFRCGHAMIRNSYRVNSDELQEASRAMQICSHRSPGFVPMGSEWAIKWEYFFEIDRCIKPNFSRRLGLSFSPIARSEYFFAPLIPRVGENGDAAGLPNRDLVSSIYARVWSVPKLIDALRAKSTAISNFLPAYGTRVPELTTWLQARSNPDGITEQFAPGDISAIVDDPPLPFFVLHEASKQNNGERLGPLGSIIVAEAILGAMQAFPLRVEKLLFEPHKHFKDQAEILKRLGLTNETIAAMPEVENFDDLLLFMQSRDLLYS